MVIRLPNALNARFARRAWRNPRMFAMRGLSTGAVFDVNASGEITFTDTGTDISFTTTDPAWPDTYTITAAQLAGLAAGVPQFIAYKTPTGLTNPPAEDDVATAVEPLVAWKAGDGVPDLTLRWLTDFSTGPTYTVTALDVIGGVDLEWTATNSGGTNTGTQTAVFAIVVVEQRITGGRLSFTGVMPRDTTVNPMPRATVMASFIYNSATGGNPLLPRDPASGTYANNYGIVAVNSTGVRAYYFMIGSGTTAFSGLEMGPLVDGDRIDMLFSGEYGGLNTVLGSSVTVRSAVRKNLGAWSIFEQSFGKTTDSIMLFPGTQFWIGADNLNTTYTLQHELIRLATWNDVTVDPGDPDVRAKFFTDTGIAPIELAEAEVGTPFLRLDDIEAVQAGTNQGNGPTPLTVGGTWINTKATPFVQATGDSFLTAPSDLPSDFTQGTLFLSFNAPAAQDWDLFGTHQRPWRIFTAASQSNRRLYFYFNMLGAGLWGPTFRFDMAPLNGSGYFDWADDDFNVLFRFDHPNLTCALQKPDGTWISDTQTSGGDIGTAWRVDGASLQVFPSTNQGVKQRRVAWWHGVAADVTSSAVQDAVAKSDKTLADVDAAPALLGTPTIDLRGPASFWNAGKNFGSLGDFTVTGSFAEV